MDYSKLSDFEINKMVSAFLWGSVCAVDGVVLHNEKDEPFDPCNNPADAWPIIERQGLSIKHVVVNRHEQTWQASFSPHYVKHKCTDKKALRAAMIVFLMMQ